MFYFFSFLPPLTQCSADTALFFHHFWGISFPGNTLQVISEVPMTRSKTVCGIQQCPLPSFLWKADPVCKEKTKVGRHPDRHFREQTCQAGSSTAYALLSRNTEVEAQILAILLMWQIWWYKKHFPANRVCKPDSGFKSEMFDLELNYYWIYFRLPSKIFSHFKHNLFIPLDKCCSAAGTEWLLPSVVGDTWILSACSRSWSFPHPNIFRSLCMKPQLHLLFQPLPHSLDQLQFIHPAAMLLLMH